MQLRRSSKSILGEIAKRDGKTRWGEKTPAHIFRLSEILSCFPNASIIHIVRDPRGAACSNIKAFEAGRFTDWSIYWKTQYWLRCIKVHAHQQKIEEPRYMFVRYEDFVQSPETSLRGVCSFLRVDFREEMLEFHRRAIEYVSKDGAGNLPLHHVLTQQPLDGSRAEAWRRILSQRHVALIEYLARKEMVALGYALESDDQSNPSGLRSRSLSALWTLSEVRRMASKQARERYWMIRH